MANFFFWLLTSIFKFPIFRFTIAIVWNNSATFYVCITSTTTSSINFGVLVCVVGFLDPFVDNTISCTNLLPSSNSNGNPFANYGLLIGTCSSDGLNSTKEGFVSTLSVCSLVACRPSCVYYYCYYKSCYKCSKCCELLVVSIQSSYTSATKCRCSSPFGNLVSCFVLTSCLYSLNYLSYGDVICHTSCLYSLDCPSCGDVICGTFVVCLVVCTIISIAHTIVGIVDGSTLPSSFFVPLLLCFHVLSSSLRLLLPQLCSSS
jgi:hypothetical protein